MNSDIPALLPKGRSSSIGVIGGGPSGIAAAWFLMKKGYKNVTLLEKNASVGGKALTVTLTDTKGITNNYELGAEYITYDYDTLFGFLSEVNEDWFESGLVVAILGNGEFDRSTRVEPRQKVIPAVLRYLWKVIQYRNIIKDPNNRNLSRYPELCESCEEFIRKNSLEALRGIFVVKQFGYGPLDNFPTIQLLRTIPLSTLTRIVVEEFPSLKQYFKRPIAALAVNGMQNLYKRMGEKLDSWKAEVYPGKHCIVTNADVVRIKGSFGIEPVEVITAGGMTYEFDKVISSVPLPFMAQMMKLSEEECKLFNKVQFHPYWVGFMETDRNLPRSYYQNLEGNNKEPTQFSKRWGDSAILTYGYNWSHAEEVEEPKTGEQVDKVLRAYMEDKMLVTEFQKLPQRRLWTEYHPHVSIEEFQNGFYDKMEALQGKQGVYFTGGGMAAESMEFSCRYSKQLVDRFFS